MTFQTPAPIVGGISPMGPPNFLARAAPAVRGTLSRLLRRAVSLGVGAVALLERWSGPLLDPFLFEPGAGAGKPVRGPGFWQGCACPDFG